MIKRSAKHSWKGLTSMSKIVSFFISEIQGFHRIRIYQNKRKIKRLQNLNAKTNPTNRKNQNQISILKKVSIKVL